MSVNDCNVTGLFMQHYISNIRQIRKYKDEGLKE